MHSEDIYSRNYHLLPLAAIAINKLQTAYGVPLFHVRLAEKISKYLM